MKKIPLIAVAIATLALTGCVAVPAYSEPYGYGYAGPPAVVVQPAFYGRYSYYGPRRHYYR